MLTHILRTQTGTLRQMLQTESQRCETGAWQVRLNECDDNHDKPSSTSDARVAINDLQEPATEDSSGGAVGKQ